MRRRSTCTLVVGILLAGCSSPESVASPPPSTSALSGSGFRLIAVGSMTTPRAAQTSTRLLDGRVLVAGGCTDTGCNLGSPGGATAELFDPSTRTFKPTGPMHISRDDHQAVLLLDGRVLVAGGWTATGVTTTTEIYDPHRGAFAQGPNMHSPRAGFAAVVLADGRVLLAGGATAAHVDSATAELFDPRGDRMLAVRDMSIARSAHAATLLDNGKVLVAGGTSRGVVVASAEVFDPATGQWTVVGSMKRARYKAGSVTLTDGRGLVIGGAADVEGQRPFTTTELYDPLSSTFVDGPEMASGRYKLIDSVVRLEGGDVVVAGGASRPEILDVQGGRFEVVNGSLGATRLFLTASAIDARRVLLVGGYDLGIRPTAQAWIIE